MAAGSGLEGLGRLGRASAYLLVIGAAVLLMASVLASVALAYMAGFTRHLAKELNATVHENPVTVQVLGSSVDAAELVSSLFTYAAATGAAAVLAALSGLLAVTAARSVLRGEDGGLARLALFWALAAAAVFALLNASKPAYAGPASAPLLGLAGALLVAAASMAPSRLAKAAAVAGLAGALLVGVAVYSGAYPYKAGTTDFTWVPNVTQSSSLLTGAEIAQALVQPVYAVKTHVAPALAGEAGALGNLMGALELVREGNLSDPVTLTSIEGRLSSAARVLRGVAEWLPSDLAERALQLAARAEALAENPSGVTEAQLLDLIRGVEDLLSSVEALEPSRLNVAAHLEALSLVYPGTALAGAIAAAAAASPARLRPALLAVAAVVAGLAILYPSLTVHLGPSKVASLYAGDLGRDLTVRTYETWRSMATAAGLIRVTSFLGVLAGGLVAVGAALALAAALKPRE